MDIELIILGIFVSPLIWILWDTPSKKRRIFFKQCFAVAKYVITFTIISTPMIFLNEVSYETYGELPQYIIGYVMSYSVAGFCTHLIGKKFHWWKKAGFQVWW